MSTLQQTIEAIEKKYRGVVMQPEERKVLHECLLTIRSLLPAEEEQRKEDMKRAYNQYYMHPFPHQIDFETWYNQNDGVSGGCNDCGKPSGVNPYGPYTPDDFCQCWRTGTS